jgi:hypothetical protein
MEWIFRARVRAQMNASRPEADSEYSRGHRVRGGTSEDPETRWRRRFEAHRTRVLASGLLGLLTIAIALLGDLPDAHSRGLVGTRTTGLSTATSSPAIGLFLETGGGVVLLLCAAAGMLLEPATDVTPRVSQDASAPRTRSAS